MSKQRKIDLKRIQALDDNFVPKKGFLTFQEVMQSLADMFLTSAKNLDSHHAISDYRWRQFKTRVGGFLDFYSSQFRRRSQRMPKVYKLDIQRSIIKTRCYCMDISPTMFRDGQMVLWKCNRCRRYLGFLNHQVLDPMEAYRLL